MLNRSHLRRVMALEDRSKAQNPAVSRQREIDELEMIYVAMRIANEGIKRALSSGSFAHARPHAYVDNGPDQEAVLKDLRAIVDDEDGAWVVRIAALRAKASRRASGF